MMGMMREIWPMIYWASSMMFFSWQNLRRERRGGGTDEVTCESWICKVIGIRTVLGTYL